MAHKWDGYSFSWTQPYGTQPYVSMNPTYQQTPSIDKEMAVIEAIDHLVDSGLTHPVADLILKEMFNKP